MCSEKLTMVGFMLYTWRHDSMSCHFSITTLNFYSFITIFLLKIASNQQHHGQACMFINTDAQSPTRATLHSAIILHKYLPTLSPPAWLLQQEGPMWPHADTEPQTNPYVLTKGQAYATLGRRSQELLISHCHPRPFHQAHNKEIKSMCGYIRQLHGALNSRVSVMQMHSIRTKSLYLYRTEIY